jgi:hypothetical protein
VLGEEELDIVAKRPARPRDPNQLAKLILDIATGESADRPGADKAKRRGGLKGGRSRALKLSAEQRRDIAKVAAAARWKRRDN